MGQQQYEYAMSAELDFASTSSSLVINPPNPIQIVRFGFMCSVALTDSDLLINGNHQLSGGGALDATGAAAIGTLTISGVLTAIDPGDGYYVSVTPYLVLPGTRAEFILAGAAAAGDGHIWAQYLSHPFVNQPSPLLATDIGGTDPADMTWLGAYTEVSS